MALRDLFSFGSPPKGLAANQREPEPRVTLPRRRRKKKPELAKQIDRIPEENEDARERLERLAKWKTRVDRSVKVRQDWERVYEIERGEKYYLGQQWDRGLRQTDLVLNHFLATMKVSLPNLLFAQPKFYVRPKPGRMSPVGDLRAAMSEGVLDYIGGQDQNLKRSAKLALVQAFLRIGVLKAVYDPRIEPNPRRGEPVFEVDSEGVVLKDESGNPVQRMDALTGELMVEPDTVMTDEMYRYEYVDARHLLLPDEGVDPQRWTWMGEQVLVPLSWAKQDSRFPVALRDQFVSNAAAGDDRRGAFAYLKSVQDDESFMYTEIYDRIGKRLIIYAEGQTFEDFLMDEPLPPGIEDHPYALLLMGDPITGPEPCPWPVPPTHSWLEPQREYNITRQQIMEGGKRSARKITYDDGTFPDADEAVKFLQDPSDMAGVKVTDTMRPPVIVASPDINPAIYRNVPMLQNDWRVISGQTGARLADPDAGSATEATFTERAANLRDADAQDMVVDWLMCAGGKMLQLVKGTLTMGLYVKMRGFSDKEFLKYAERYLQIPQEQLLMLLEAMPQIKSILMARFSDERWQFVTREDLTYETDVTVAPGSLRPRNLDVERRNWLELLQIVGQFPQLALSRELLRETASKFEGINERMLDELHALAKQMVQINANQAGRTQGGSMNGGGATSATAGAPDLGALVAGMMGGAG